MAKIANTFTWGKSKKSSGDIEKIKKDIEEIKSNILTINNTDLELAGKIAEVSNEILNNITLINKNKENININTNTINILKTKIEELKLQVLQNKADIESVLDSILTIQNDLRDLGNNVNENNSEIQTLKQNITHLNQSKQDNLVAGQNIEISGNMISAIIPTMYNVSDTEVFAGFYAFNKKVYCRCISGVSTKQIDNIELITNVSRVISHSFFATNYQTYNEYQELPFYYNNNDRVVIRNDKTQKSVWLHRQWEGSNVPVYYYGTVYYIKENE